MKIVGQKEDMRPLPDAVSLLRSFCLTVIRVLSTSYSLCWNPRIGPLLHSITSVSPLSGETFYLHCDRKKKKDRAEVCAFFSSFFPLQAKNTTHLFICLSFEPHMNTFNKAALIPCFAHMCFRKRERCCIGKHYYSGTRCKMTARHREAEDEGERESAREMRELLRGDIIGVSRSEHVSIYIQRSSARRDETSCIIHAGRMKEP